MKGTMMCRRDRLPKSVPMKYFNFSKAAPVNVRSKVAQFKQPIIAVKHVKHQDSGRVTDKKDYVPYHVSFQSTGGTNISVVNALLLLDLYVRVVGRLYSVQYKGIFGAPDKVRRNTCKEARPLRLDFQRDKVKIHHVIALTQDCWS